MCPRQLAGVQVNVIYDSAGALGTGRSFYQHMADAGIAVVEFNPINPLAGGKPWRMNHRDHRKLMVIDGRTAFLGGINISSVYSRGSSFGREESVTTPHVGWRDTDIRIDGPVVAEFQRLFFETWNKQGGKPLGPGYFPDIPVQGSEMVRAIGSTPDDPYSQIYLTLISAITHAQKQVSIINAYFVPDPQLLDALTDAVVRGVDVRLILPSQSDSGLAFHAARSYYRGLLKGGVKIYERRGPPLHAKTAVIDGVWSCVGSSNLDWRSALDNDEVNAIMLGREFAHQMLEAYESDIRASDEIRLASWERRSMGFRLKETVARLFGRLLEAGFRAGMTPTSGPAAGRDAKKTGLVAPAQHPR